MWHERLGHVNLKTIKCIMILDLIPKFEINSKTKCEICVQAKQPRKPFKSVERKAKLLLLIHSDICDLKNIITHGEEICFITFIDDFSKYCYIYLINSKNEFYDKFKIYKILVENQLDNKIKNLRSDRRGGYISKEMSEFCDQHGIIHQTTALYSPQSNGL